MPSEPVMDIDSILAPIDGDNPAGTDLREDTSPNSPYYKIRTARGLAAADERNVDNNAFPGQTPGDIEKAKRETLLQIPKHWKVVYTTAVGALAKNSKDLDIATWLIEASIRLEGFAGLRDAFKVATGLVGNFWDNIYPRPDEDGDEGVVSTLAGLSGRGGTGSLIGPIRKFDLVQDEEDGFTYGDYLAASRGGDPASLVQSRLGGIDRGYLAQLRDDLGEAIAAAQQLEETLDQRLGSIAPSFGGVRTELEAILELVVSVVGRPAAPAPEAEEVAEEAAAPASGGGGAPAAAAQAKVAPGAIIGRDDAFSRLLEIAKYFQKTEPQSPIALAIEEVVRRGRLSFAELVAELVPDEDAMKKFYIGAGIKPR